MTIELIFGAVPSTIRDDVDRITYRQKRSGSKTYNYNIENLCQDDRLAFTLASPLPLLIVFTNGNKNPLLKCSFRHNLDIPFISKIISKISLWLKCSDLSSHQLLSHLTRQVYLWVPHRFGFWCVPPTTMTWTMWLIHGWKGMFTSLLAIEP